VVLKKRRFITLKIRQFWGFAEGGFLAVEGRLFCTQGGGVQRQLEEGFE